MEENNTEKKFRSASFSWYPGHMAKTKRQIIEDLKLIDIIIEVLDARIPMSSRNPDVEEYAKQKNRILVLNKADLADEDVTKMWIKYFKDKKIDSIIAVESNSGKGINQVLEEIKKQYAEISEKYSKKGREGRSAKVMIVGIPNVGKSTFINSVSKRNIAKVENRPGVTQRKQWIKLEQGIELMDTPGMLWPKLDSEEVAMHLAFTNSIKQTAIDNEEIAYFLLKYLIENYREKIEERYNIQIVNKNEIESEDVLEVRENIARKKGCILSGGRIDERKVSDMILRDFQDGKLGRISLEKPDDIINN